jgi:type IX secretion system PorP/SprF family membrane protein
MRVRIIAIVVFCIGLTVDSKAQMYPVFSQYYFNELMINPAFAGAHVQLSATATYRNQWINFPGSPKTFSLSAHSSFLRGKVGLGFMVNVDKIGSYSNQDITMSMSYKLKFPKATLSFGMQGMLYVLNADFSTLKLKAPDDPDFVPYKQISPNIGAGLYYNRRNFFVGFSAPFLINTTFTSSGVQVTPGLEQRRYYFLRSGFIAPLDVKENFKINPSILARFQEGQPMSMDFNLAFIFYDTFSSGVSYRAGDSIIGMVSMKLTEQLFFNYSYDFTTSNLGPFTSGTQEIMLNFRAKVTQAHKNLGCPHFHSYRESSEFRDR